MPGEATKNTFIFTGLNLSAVFKETPEQIQTQYNYTKIKYVRIKKIIIFCRFVTSLCANVYSITRTLIVFHFATRSYGEQLFYLYFMKLELYHNAYLKTLR